MALILGAMRRALSGLAVLLAAWWPAMAAEGISVRSAVVQADEDGYHLSADFDITRWVSTGRPSRASSMRMP